MRERGKRSAGLIGLVQGGQREWQGITLGCVELLGPDVNAQGGQRKRRAEDLREGRKGAGNEASNRKRGHTGETETQIPMGKEEQNSQKKHYQV